VSDAIEQNERERTGLAFASDFFELAIQLQLVGAFS